MKNQGSHCTGKYNIIWTEGTEYIYEEKKTTESTYSSKEKIDLKKKKLNEIELYMMVSYLVP